MKDLNNSLEKLTVTLGIMLNVTIHWIKSNVLKK